MELVKETESKKELQTLQTPETPITHRYGQLPRRYERQTTAPI